MFSISSVIFGSLSLVLAVISAILRGLGSVESGKKLWTKFGIPSISLFLISFPLSYATPSTKTVAVMYAVPAIVNSKPVQQDLPELYQMGVEVLKAQLAPKPPAKLETPAK